MNDITVNVVGNVASDVDLRVTKGGHPVASFRIAVGTRRYDQAQGGWVDGDTHFFTVNCWRGLAHNVLRSFTKGMPVLVTGRLRTREVARQCGDHSHPVRYYDIEASSAGPDLARGVATFTRVKRDAVVASEQRALAEARAIIDTETGEILSEPAA